MDLNNRRTGKHATKPRALGLLGHSVILIMIIVQVPLGALWGGGGAYVCEMGTSSNNIMQIYEVISFIPISIFQFHNPALRDHTYTLGLC